MSGMNWPPIGYTFVLLLLVSAASTGRAQTKAEQDIKTAEHIQTPFFRDPVYDGAADPEIVWNRHAREWWIFYTGRRAKMEGGMTYAGCAIGVAASRDWKNWRHLGYCKFDGMGGVADSQDTFWAPGIVFDGEKYHMFVVFKKGRPIPWNGEPSIVHYVAPANNLLNGWEKVAVVETPKRCIDAGLCKVGEEWHMWLKHGGKVHLMTSADLYSWIDRGKVTGTVNEQRGIEGPYVFFWKERYWMLTDPHNGIQVYVSKDADQWEKAGTVLEGPGERPLDLTRGRHPSAAVVGDRVFVFYHVEPYRPYPPLHRNLPAGQKSIKQKLSVLQAAELTYENGKLSCNRNPLLPSSDDLTSEH
jgi:hypothetical protein